MLRFNGYRLYRRSLPPPVRIHIAGFYLSEPFVRKNPVHGVIRVEKIKQEARKDLNRWRKLLFETSAQGLVTNLETYMSEMATLGLQVTIADRNLFLETCLKTIESKKAFEYIQRIYKQRASPSSFLATLDSTSFKLALLACGKTGDFHSAQELINIMRDAGIRVNAGPWDALIQAVRNTSFNVIQRQLMRFTSCLFLLLMF